MSKYEIMLILDPKSDDKNLNDIASATFKNKAKIEKLERTELAYEINKSKTALYYLVSIEATGEEINEFMRKANIAKNIWRSLSVNLDSEKGLNRKAKPKKIRKVFVKKTPSDSSQQTSTPSNSIEKNKKTTTDLPKSKKESTTTTKKTTKKVKEDK